MLRTVDGKMIPEVKRGSRVTGLHAELYIQIKEKEDIEGVIKRGLISLNEFYARYTLEKEIWSYAVIRKFIDSNESSLWRATIDHVFPSMNKEDLEDKVAGISGVALLDFLACDANNEWVIDKLQFKEINEPLNQKRYIKA